MPSPTTAGQLITGALRLSGVVGKTETPDADDFAEGLQGFNDLLEILSTENMAVYGSALETFPTVAGQSVYTIGPAGNWNTTRPVNLNWPYCTFNGVDFPIEMINQGEYNDIALKTQQQPIVEKLLFINDFPLGRITLWPVPSGIISIFLNTDRVLTNVTDTTTAVNAPPGYALMYRYMLAVLLCGSYGVPCPGEISSIAASARANVKRANRVQRVAQYDPALVGSDPAIWQTGV